MLNKLLSVRYIAVFAILVFVILFGEKFSQQDNKDVELIKQNKYLIENHKVIGSDQSEIFFQNIFTKPGESYHLDFFLSIKLDDNNNDDYLAGMNRDISIFAESFFKDEMSIGKITPMSEKFYRYGMTFTAQSNYEKIVFKKVNRNGKFTIHVKEPNLTPISSNYNIENLKETIFGNSELVLETASGEADNLSSVFRFNYKNSSVGQIFKSESDRLASLDLALNIIKAGGVGKYRIGVKKVEILNGTLVPNGDDFAAYYFDISNIDDYKVSNNIYRFPLTARLEFNKYYLISLSNAEVKFNRINTLEVLGTKHNNYKNGGLVTFDKKNNYVNKVTDIYFKIWGLQNIKYNTESILTNAIIQDNGNGKGIFNWETKGEGSDFLDIEEVDIFKVFYDSVSQGISGSLNRDASFIYKLNTVYSMSRISIQVNEQNFNSSRAYYSFDKTNWKQMSRNKNDGNKIRAIFDGEGKKIIYIKIEWDEFDKTNEFKQVQLFGISGLKVKAELIIE